MSDLTDVYHDLGQRLEQAGLAEHALFLNWGYQDPDASPLSAGESQRQLVLQLLAGTAFEKRQVLDVGCGRGGAAALLVEMFRPLSVTGIDLSPGNIAFCRQRHRHPRLRFRLADACQLPQAEGSIDVLLNIESSGAYQDIIGFWREAWRVLKPGGVFLYADLFAADSLPDVLAALDALGFTLEHQRSIRREVMAARRQNSDRLVQRLLTPEDDAHAAQQLRDYFALPGSPVYGAMEQGRVDYCCLRLVKPPQAAMAGEVPPSLTARLAQRAPQLAAAVEGRSEPAGGFPLQRPDADAELNLFALPYAGGGASIYREWGRDTHWPAGWRFCALQLPGRENRIDEPGCDRMATLVAALAAEIAPYAHRPWALVGCSLGCKIAFELARHFSQRGQPPRLLFLMACPAPHIPVNHRLSGLDEARFTAEVQRLGGTPEAVTRDAAMMRTVGKALRADCALAEHYLSPIDCPLDVPAVLVLAEDDALVTPAQMAAWQPHFSQPVATLALRGGHFFMRQHRARLEQRLISALLPQLKKPAAKVWFPFGEPQAATGRPVIAFHHAGGAAAVWRDWLAPAAQWGLTLCPVELPGHGTRFSEECVDDLEALLDNVAALVIACRQPCILLGHSLGTLFAFELAQRLPKENVAGVVVAARRPPQHATPRPWRHSMTDGQLAAELAALGGTPRNVMENPELLSLFLPALRADFCLTETYRCQHGAEGRTLPLLVLGGDRDQEVPEGALHGWLEWGNGESRCEVMAGDHFFLHSQPEQVLRTLAQWLSEVGGDTAPAWRHSAVEKSG